ncbi:hypothetical protein TNCV_4670691 [Trichonephila clavipes]|nr:hypothetical protein TNCV_4670691 [Trichonephila clavipes]
MDDLRTVAVRQGNSEFGGSSFVPSEIGHVDGEERYPRARGITRPPALEISQSIVVYCGHTSTRSLPFLPPS